MKPQDKYKTINFTFLKKYLKTTIYDFNIKRDYDELKEKSRCEKADK